jgi:hypothetical protein
MFNRRDPSRRQVLAAAPVVSSGPPDSSNLLFWGDLSSPLTVVTGGAVETLGDGSGNGNSPTQAVALSRPIYAASDMAFGGQPSMTFDGVVQMLAGSALASQAAVSFYCVMSLANSLSGAILLAAGASNEERAALGLFADSFYALVSIPTSADTSAALSTPIALSTPFVLAGTVNAAAGGDCALAYVDGVANGAPFATGAVAGVTPNLPLYVGGDPAGGSAPITMTDSLIYSGVHSPATVAAVSAWLAARNGL